MYFICDHKLLTPTTQYKTIWLQDMYANYSLAMTLQIKVQLLQIHIKT